MGHCASNQRVKYGYLGTETWSRPWGGRDSSLKFWLNSRQSLRPRMCLRAKMCTEIRFQADKLIPKFNNFQMLIHLAFSVNLSLLPTLVNFTHIHLINDHLFNIVLGTREKQDREFPKQDIRNDFILQLHGELSLDEWQVTNSGRAFQAKAWTWESLDQRGIACCSGQAEWCVGGATWERVGEVPQSPGCEGAYLSHWRARVLPWSLWAQRALFREVAQSDPVTYKNYSLIGYIESKEDRSAHME